MLDIYICMTLYSMILCHFISCQYNRQANGRIPGIAHPAGRNYENDLIHHRLSTARCLHGYRRARVC